MCCARMPSHGGATWRGQGMQQVLSCRWQRACAPLIRLASPAINKDCSTCTASTHDNLVWHWRAGCWCCLQAHTGYQDARQFASLCQSSSREPLWCPISFTPHLDPACGCKQVLMPMTRLLLALGRRGTLHARRNQSSCPAQCLHSPAQLHPSAYPDNAPTYTATCTVGTAGNWRPEICRWTPQIESANDLNIGCAEMWSFCLSVEPQVRAQGMLIPRTQQSMLHPSCCTRHQACHVVIRHNLHPTVY